MDTTENAGNITGDQVIGGEANGEEEEEEVEPDASGFVTKTVETKNKKFGNIKVEIRINTAPSVQEYASEDYYGSEEAVKKALDADWTRRKANSARPVLRDSETELDWQDVAQRTSDQYKPGRRGGFTPTIEADALRGATSVDDVIAMLREKGVQII